MKILAIDPGTFGSAFVAWDTVLDDFIQSGDIRLNRGLWDNTEFYDSFERLLNVNEIETVALEMIQSYGTTVGRSTFTTVLFVGRITEVVKNYRKQIKELGPSVKYYGRPTIKAQIGGRNDSEIRASLRLRYGEAKKGNKLEGVKRDIWSALALATALTEKPNLKEW